MSVLDDLAVVDDKQRDKIFIQRGINRGSVDATTLALYSVNPRLELYVGKNIQNEEGDIAKTFRTRSLFWRSPDGRYWIDYGHNLNHLLGNALQILNFAKTKPKPEAEKQSNELRVLKHIRYAIAYLDENLRMFEEGAVEMADAAIPLPDNKVLLMPYAQVFSHLSSLRIRLWALEAIPVWTEQFRTNVGKITRAYMKFPHANVVNAGYS